MVSAPTTTRKKAGKIAIVLDERLQRNQKGVLSRIVHTVFKIFATVDILGEKTTEAQTLEKMREGHYDLVLLPWHVYLDWKKVEAFFGSARTSGPTVAGYFCEPLPTDSIPLGTEYSRMILLDFSSLGPKEIGIVVRNLIEDKRRCGIRPFLRADQPVWSENWFQGQGLGMRIDSILSLPELIEHDWLGRAHSIRTIVVALWSLIYEEGPGKSEFRQAIAGSTAVASFQMAVDERCFLFRLCFQLPGATPRAILEKFRHDPTAPGSAAQYLMRYSDLVRAHIVSESHDVEVVVALFKSAACEKNAGSFHTLWVEPVTAQLMTEPAFVPPGQEHPLVKPLPEAPLSSPRPNAQQPAASPDKAKDRYILEAAQKIRELRRILDQREQTIRELRSGGVGGAGPALPSDPEALLEAFQAQYFAFKHNIRQLELELVQLTKSNATPEALESLRKRMAEMGERERGWIQVLAKTVSAYAQALKGGTGDAAPPAAAGGTGSKG